MAILALHKTAFICIKLFSIPYLNGFIPGQTLYRSQLGNFAIVNGAADAIVTTPAANVIPTALQVIRPGVINVT